MKIGELARRANLKPSALRYYESIGLLPAPLRAAGQRRYASDALDRVLFIRFAVEMGFTLSEIKLFLSGLRHNSAVGPRWRKLARRKLHELEHTLQRTRRLKSLLQHLLRCQCPALSVCVNRLSLNPTLRHVAPFSP